MQRVPFIKAVVMTPGSLINSAVSNFTFLITPTVPINNSHVLIVTFPPEITLPKSSSSFLCVSPDTNVIQSVSCQINTNSSNQVLATLSLKPGLPGISPLQTFRLTIAGLTNPPTTKPTGLFDLALANAQLQTL